MKFRTESINNIVIIKKPHEKTEVLMAIHMKCVAVNE